MLRAVYLAIELSSNFAAWFIAVATALALTLGVWQSARAQQRRYDWERKQTALTYSVANRPELREARASIDRAFKEIEIGRPIGELNPPSQEMIKITLERSDLSPTSLVLLLGHWENLALAINNGVADEYMAYEMVATTVRRHVTFFRDFIATRRRTSPRYYSNLILLNERWCEFLDRGLTARQVRRRMKRSQFRRSGVLGYTIPPEVERLYSPIEANPPVLVARSTPTRKRLLVLVDEGEIRAHDSIFGLLGAAVAFADKGVDIDVASVVTPSNFTSLMELESESLLVHHLERKPSYDELSKLSHHRQFQSRNLRDYAGIWLRLDPPLNWAFLRTLQTRTKAPIVNRPEGIERFGKKSILATEFSGLAGGAELCSTTEAVDRLVERWGEVVLKPDEGVGGGRILRLSATSGFFEEKQSDPETVRTIMLRDFNAGNQYLVMPFSPRISEGDRRILLAGNEILGVIERVPKPGSWLVNLGRGGTTRIAEMEEGDRVIVDEVARGLNASGVVLAGIDTLTAPDGSRWLSEINAANVGLFRQLAEDSGDPEVYDRAVAAVMRQVFGESLEGLSPSSDSNP